MSSSEFLVKDYQKTPFARKLNKEIQDMQKALLDSCLKPVNKDYHPAESWLKQTRVQANVR